MIRISHGKLYNGIVHYVDVNNFIIYSYDTGKFYLINIDTLTSALANKFRDVDGKVYVYENELCEITEKAQNPNFVNYSEFSYPMVIGVMVTNKCNLMCNYCIANNGNSYSVKDNFSKFSSKVLDELRSSSVMSVMVSGGEPTLYNNLSSFLKTLSHGNFLCLLDTNGVNMDDKLLCTLKRTGVIPRISLDSVFSNEHNANRGMFAETFSNISKLISMGVDLRINTVITKTNIDSLSELAEWLCYNNVDKWHIFKLQQTFAPRDIWVNDNDVENVLSYLSSNYGEKIDILFKFSRKNDGFASFVIDSDGVCFSTRNTDDGRGEKQVFGDITQKSLSEIWKNTPNDYRLRHYNKYLSYPNKSI